MNGYARYCAPNADARPYGAPCASNKVRVIPRDMKALTLLFSFGLIASNGNVVTFDNGPAGVEPAGWSFAAPTRGHAPQWRVLKDTSAPTQPNVLAQVSRDGDERCPIAIYDRLTVENGDFQVRIKPVSGRDDRSGGVVWRYQDPNNYYLVRLNALTNDIVLFKVEKGVRSQLSAPVPHDIPSNAWSILKVSVRGNRFQVYVNHRRVLQGVDSTFRAPGKVGLWTAPDSITYFDDFRAYPK